jgi:rod shape-determining protein MreC
MYNLLKFISKYHFIFLFVILQLISLAFIFQNNSFQKVVFLNSANSVTGWVYSNYAYIKNYVGLREQNEKLAEENAMLKSNFSLVYYVEVPSHINDCSFYTDTVYLDTTSRFSYLPATVISNTINRLYNTIFLDKGTKHGIETGMGVTGTDGIVGVVKQTTENYSLVMPIINRDVNVSAKIKNTGYFGNLSWDGKNPEYAQLSEIPNHIYPQQGDTVITSGYSHMFPEGETVGYVESFKDIPGTGFLLITVKLSTNFNTLKYVYAIKNKDLEEISILDCE